MISVRITVGTDTAIMRWNPSEASAPIELDGAPTQYQTADARHRTAAAVRLMCAQFGRVFDDEAAARAAGCEPGASEIVCWDEDVAYEIVDDAAAPEQT